MDNLIGGEIMTDKSEYWIGYAICWVIIFIGSWIYCISEYGFLIGVGIGWLPSIIAALVGAIFWPLYLLVIVGFIIWWLFLVIT